MCRIYCVISRFLSLWTIFIYFHHFCFLISKDILIDANVKQHKTMNTITFKKLKIIFIFIALIILVTKSCYDLKGVDEFAIKPLFHRPLNGTHFWGRILKYSYVFLPTK